MKITVGLKSTLEQKKPEKREQIKKTSEAICKHVWRKCTTISEILRVADNKKHTSCPNKNKTRSKPYVLEKELDTECKHFSSQMLHCDDVSDF